MNAKQAGDLLDELARRWQLKNPKSNYAECLHAVMAADENAALVLAYCERDAEPRQSEPRSFEHSELQGISLLDLGLKVDALTKRYMAEHDVKDYGEAMIAALGLPENAELREAYAYARQN